MGAPGRRRWGNGLEFSGSCIAQLSLSRKMDTGQTNPGNESSLASGHMDEKKRRRSPPPFLPLPVGCEPMWASPFPRSVPVTVVVQHTVVKEQINRGEKETHSWQWIPTSGNSWVSHRLNAVHNVLEASEGQSVSTSRIPENHSIPSLYRWGYEGTEETRPQSKVIP